MRNIANCVENKKRFSSSSMKLLLFMIPLLVVSLFVAMLGPKSYNSKNWVFNFRSHEYDYNNYGTNNSVNSYNYVLHGEEQSFNSVMVQDLDQEQEEQEQSPLEAKEQSHFGLDEPIEFNSSNSPSLGDVHVVQVIGPNAGKEENGTQNSDFGSPNILASPNIMSLKFGVQTKVKEHTNLEKLESGLQKARAAIKEAKNENQIDDPDYVPIGPVYHNSKVFHRSYLEMEKLFKVFVYEEGEPPVFHNGPCKSIYSMEGNFIHRMEIDGFRTKDPEKAHVYFLPFSVAMMVQFVYVRDTHDFGPIRKTVRDYVRLIAGKYPYWNRSLAADHFMLACHDWGPETSFSVPYLAKNSIRALCNANTSERFNPIKDVSFPEINLQSGTILGLVGGPSASKRPILAFFAGGLHGPIRPILLKHWENSNDDDMKIYRYLPKGMSYYGMMKKSKYCLCPSGYEVASPRIVEALYAGCVPVLLSDHYVPPFSDVLNWKSFSVEVPVHDIPNLKRILTSISPRQYIRMQRRVVIARRHFEVNSPPKRFDVFHMILHSVWLRRLNIRIQ